MKSSYSVSRSTVTVLLLLVSASGNVLAKPPGLIDPMFTQKGAGAQPRTVASKLTDAVSVKDFGAACDDVQDDTAAIQQALTTVGVSGGTLTVPVGTCKVMAPLSISKRTTIVGAGRQSSKLHFTHSGDGLKSTWAINTSTAAWIVVRDIAIVNSNASNSGGGFVDVGGSFIDLNNVFLQGWKYGVIFDQSEIATIDSGEILSGNGAAGVWIVNGADHTPGAKRHFTNRITISRTQFNATTAASYNILDDGGGSHSIRDNNFNSGAGALRAANTSALVVSGNESEGHINEDIALLDTTAAGVYVGPSSAFHIDGNQLVSGHGGRNITIQNANNGVISGNMFGQAAAAINFVNGSSNPSSGVIIEGNSKIVSGNGITAGPFVAGFSRSLRSNLIRQVANTYSSAAAMSGPVVITPATMELIRLGSRLTLMNTDGSNVEDVTVTAATNSTFTATLAKPKTSNFIIYGATPGTEEAGTWMPVLAGSNTPGTNSYLRQSGQYVRIGNMVIVKGQISVSAKGSMSGTILIKGLPFASEDVSNGTALATMGLWSGVSIGANQQLGGVILPGDNSIGLRKSSTDGRAIATVQDADLPGATIELHFQAIYFTSAL